MQIIAATVVPNRAAAMATDRTRSATVHHVKRRTSGIGRLVRPMGGLWCNL